MSKEISENQMHFYFWIWFSINYVTFADATAYMGPNMTFKCNCDDNQCSNATGICINRFPCRKGFFGFACQYSNAFDYSSYTIPELADDSYDTCVAGKSSLAINFNYTRVRFLKLTVTDTSEFGSLKFSFNTNDSCKTCDGIFILSNIRVIEYHCQCLVKADGLFIDNIYEIPICHIEVSKGRNMGVRHHITATDPTDQFYSKDGLNDGITDLKKRTCYLEKEQSTGVIIVLDPPITLSMVEIYDVPKDYTAVRNIDIEIGIKGIAETGSSAKIEDNRLEVKRYIPDEEILEVQSVTLVTGKAFGACEIQVIGDCPRGKFGLACSDDCLNGCKWCTMETHCIIPTCSPNCINVSCDAGGVCLLGCEHGHYGPHCYAKCSPNCVNSSCEATGNCMYGCVKGHYGPKCNSECSPSCVNNSCEAAGNCRYGCLEGHYGPNCYSALTTTSTTTLNTTTECTASCAGDSICDSNGICTYGYCSENCAQNKTCSSNRTCTFGCRTGYFEHNCTSKCSGSCADDGSCLLNGTCKYGCTAGFYGPDCTLNCSQICEDDRTCDLNGMCKFGCRPGYLGAICSSNCSGSCADDGSCLSNGTCQYGCMAGFYGPECNLSCSRFCANNGACNQEGECTFGCKKGYFGKICDIIRIIGCSSDCISVSAFHGACTLIEAMITIIVIVNLTDTTPKFVTILACIALAILELVQITLVFMNGLSDIECNCTSAVPLWRIMLIYQFIFNGIFIVADIVHLGIQKGVPWATVVIIICIHSVFGMLALPVVLIFRCTYAIQMKPVSQF